ncbi:ATP-binding protein [Hyalangium rubrum]|uniref:histidine kinase n=1 Tax=Hyalangium rubrum TaxID=3103134 RepID=A0ABU5H7V5_9BACT|nr:ATP-binding protein [Hyalangium sp. s54d21]MDY7229391.1 ATP-binding protein [Hyalangium sp. s54d21]
MSPTPRHRWQRTAGIPLLLVLIYAVCFGLYSLRRETQTSVRNDERFTLRKVTVEMAQLQSTLETFLREGKLTVARELVAGMSSNPHLQVGLLIDDRQTVVASTRLALLDRKVSEAWPELLRLEHAERMGRARRHMTGIVEVSADGQRVVGYYPVFLSFDRLPEKVGFLYFQHDLATLKAASLYEVQRSVLRSSLMLLLIAGTMGLVIQLTLGRRIQRLTEAAREVVAGKPGVASTEESDDALGRLGQAVSQMAEQIGRNQQELEENEARFQTLIERSPDATFIHWEGKVVFHNPAAAALLGYAQATELRGRQVAELVAPEDVAALTGPMESDTPREVRWVHLAGRQVLGEVVTFPLVFERQPMRVSIVRDITERRQFQDKLNAADRMASLGTLAAGVAHEINNPLSFMLSNVRFVSEELRALSDGWDAPTRERLREVHAALEETLAGGDRVRDIVRDLRTFSRRDEGARGPVNLHSVLDLCGNIARGQLRHRAQLVKDYGVLPLIHGSESRLGQLFLNLIVNAAQAIPEGRDPKVQEVRVTTRREGADWVVVEVKDTGVGISPEHQRRLFEPFFTTKPEGVGTGLGLSICHGIVSALGGRITVESEPGHGSTFRVFLPVGATA